MWIVVPSTFCPFAPEPGDSTLASAWRSKMLGQSATLKMKLTPAKSWLRAWKTKPWIQRLFGRIYAHSMARRGIELWIASLAESHASHTALPENVWVKPILETFGLTPKELSRKCPHSAYSLRTSQGCFLPEEPKLSMKSWTEWTSGLKQDYLVRKKLAGPAKARGYSGSLWRRPVAALGYKTFLFDGTGANLAGQAIMWMVGYRFSRQDVMPKNWILNPRFTEWMLGWPLGWTTIKTAFALPEMVLYQRRLHSHLLRLLRVSRNKMD